MTDAEQTRPLREVRAHYSERTIRVYQAYSPAIALPALAAQRFVSPFKRERMTWIKPSFTWMMYRAGSASKEGQEHVLAIEITREGIEWALAHACISHYDPAFHRDPEAWRADLAKAPVRIQWDPERDLRLEPLPWRSLQIGLSGDAVAAYVDRWTVRIDDVSALAREIASLVAARELERAAALRPVERRYPLSTELAARIGCTSPSVLV
jgi:hypothetical protein